MSYCADCGVTFHCGMVDKDKHAPCWCSSMAPMPLQAPTPASEAAARCYCPQCLQRRLEQHQSSGEP